MLGTEAAGWQYHACEPNPVTYANLLRMIAFVGGRAHIHNQPAESFDVGTVGPVDIVLTSPPYFNLEVYDHAANQCYNQWCNFEQWRDCWLAPVINHCLDHLKPDGISAWNVMNFKKHDLVEAVIHVHRARGWTLIDTLGFQSPLNNIRKLRNRDVTYVFRHQNHRSVVDFAS